MAEDYSDGNTFTASYTAAGQSFTQARAGTEFGGSPWDGSYSYTPPANYVKAAAYSNEALTTYSGHTSTLWSWWVHHPLLANTGRQSGADWVAIPTNLAAGGPTSRLGSCRKAGRAGPSRSCPDPGPAHRAQVLRRAPAGLWGARRRMPGLAAVSDAGFGVSHGPCFTGPAVRTAARRPLGPLPHASRACWDFGSRPAGQTPGKRLPGLQVLLAADLAVRVPQPQGVLCFVDQCNLSG
jgi:hypothetical protein